MHFTVGADDDGGVPKSTRPVVEYFVDHAGDIALRRARRLTEFGEFWSVEPQRGVDPIFVTAAGLKAVQKEFREYDDFTARPFGRDAYVLAGSLEIFA